MARTPAESMAHHPRPHGHSGAGSAVVLSATCALGKQSRATKSIRGVRDAKRGVRATRASVGSLGAARHTNRAKTARRPVGSPSAANSSTMNGGATKSP